jgi:G3E family GTPase
MSPNRTAFVTGCVCVVVSGLFIILLNFHIAKRGRNREIYLSRLLWKFVPDEDLLLERCWQWRLLVLVGVMFSSTILAMFSLRLGLKQAFATAGIIFILWCVSLVYFWYFTVLPMLKERERANFHDPKLLNKERKDGWFRKAKGNGGQDGRLPVTIITGFLGSGKTTLVKNILHTTVGMKVLVIENEIGSEGIDHDLLLRHTEKEEIILMNNGCVCCTVRNDLIKSFHRIFESDAMAKLDWVVIETTGLADPAPLIQSLYIDQKCKQRLRLDGVVTVVDCAHFQDQISRQNYHGEMISEARLQVVFADRIVLNKIDLLAKDASALEKVLDAVRCINLHAKIFQVSQSEVSIDELINIRAFDASRNASLLRTLAQEDGYNVEMEGPIFIQRHVNGKIRSKAVGASHEVKSCGICTVSLLSTEPLHFDRLNEWLAGVLRDHGKKLYRLKGILCVSGHNRQFVAQGVHMIFDGERGLEWPSSGELSRKSRLVLIGLNLPVPELQKGWQDCRC